MFGGAPPGITPRYCGIQEDWRFVMKSSMTLTAAAVTALVLLARPAAAGPDHAAHGGRHGGHATQAAHGGKHGDQGGKHGRTHRAMQGGHAAHAAPRRMAA